MTAEEISVYISTWNSCRTVKQFHEVTGLSREEIRLSTRRLRYKGYELKLMEHGPVWGHTPKPKNLGKCLHCTNNKAFRPRGLCKTCYDNLEIRNCYQKLIDYNDHTKDMTTEQLDAIIAEQSKPENLPKWWAKHVKMMADMQDRQKDAFYYYVKIRCRISLSAPKRLAM